MGFAREVRSKHKKSTPVPLTLTKKPLKLIPITKKLLMVARDVFHTTTKTKNNPEVRRILSDPAMKMILDQCQRDPQALREHIKDPKVAGDIQKLMDVGILQVR